MSGKFQIENKTQNELSKRGFFREISALGAGMALFTSMSAQAQTKGSFTLVTLELKTKAGKAEPLCVEVFGPALTATRRYDGFIEMVVYTEQALDTVFIMEKWQSKAHYEKYLKWRLDTGLVEAISPYLAQAPVIRYFDPRPE
jgi:quinol monooxygenase YgiN